MVLSDRMPDSADLRAGVPRSYVETREGRLNGLDWLAAESLTSARVFALWLPASDMWRLPTISFFCAGATRGPRLPMPAGCEPHYQTRCRQAWQALQSVNQSVNQSTGIASPRTGVCVLAGVDAGSLMHRYLVVVVDLDGKLEKAVVTQQLASSVTAGTTPALADGWRRPRTR